MEHLVLIVAKCNVNVFAPESKADYMFVLIVAKCNVNCIWKNS